MKVKRLVLGLGSAMLLVAPAAFADVRTQCFDVKISKDISYFTCKTQQSSNLLQQEKELAALLGMTKRQIEKAVAEQWQPPMGFSGYSVNVSYSITPRGNFYSVKFDDYYISDELKNSLQQAMKRAEPFYLPLSKEAAERITTVTFKSNFYIK